MTPSRRHFVGSSLVALSGALLDAINTPIWNWRNPIAVEAATQSHEATGVQYFDVASQAGLRVPNVWGGIEHKRLVVETKGSGIAFFDYDKDGWLDIYLTNGNRLDANWPPGQIPTTHLYKNNRDGTFTDVTEKSGIGRSGWQTGATSSFWPARDTRTTRS